MNKSKLLMVIAILVVIYVPTAVGRLARSSANMNEKIARADMIVIAVAKGEEKTNKEAWPLRTFHVLQVLNVLKGQVAPKEIRLVTDSLGGEWRPHCCVAGVSYILFLNNGYPVFDTEGDTTFIKLLQTEHYVSSSDGAFGAYEIRGERVIGWPNKAEQTTNFKGLVKLITKMEKKQKNAASWAPQ